MRKVALQILNMHDIDLDIDLDIYEVDLDIHEVHH